ncbi:hypothetical protein PCE1_003508 [Barthelona sp. PCE]
MPGLLGIIDSGLDNTSPSYESPEDSFALAVEYFLNSDYKRCLQHCKGLLRSFNDKIIILKRIALCHWELNHKDKARETLQTIYDMAKTERDHSIAKYVDSFFCLKEGNMEKAESLCDSALSLAPYDSNLHHLYGDIQYGLNRFKKAVNEYTSSLSLLPNTNEVEIRKQYGVLYSARGHCHVHLLSYKKACEDFKKAVEYDPYSISYKIDLGNIYRQMEMKTSARRWFMEILTLHGYNSHALKCFMSTIGDLNTTDIKLRTQEFRILASQLQTICSILEQYDEEKGALISCLSTLAKVYFLSHRFEDALRYYQKCAEMGGERAKRHIALCLQKLKRFPEALRVYEDGVLGGPVNVSVYTDMADCYRFVGLFNNAISILLLGLKQYDHVNLHVALAQIYLQLSLPQKALNEAMRAKRLAQKSSVQKETLLANLIYCSIQRQHFSAVTARDQLLDLSKEFPNNPILLNELGLALKDCEESIEAIKCFERALKLPGVDYTGVLAAMVHTKFQVCDWSHINDVFEQLVRLTEQQLRAGLKTSVTPFHAQIYPFPPVLTLRIVERYAMYISDIVKTYDTEPFDFDNGSRYRKGTIRIGYVSPCFRKHPLCHLTYSLFKNHDTSKFTIFCYSLCDPDESTYLERVRDATDEGRRLVSLKDLSFVEAAHRIYNDNIDILIALDGHSRDTKNEIFALRPAPKCVSLLGLPGSTGAPWIDYTLTDEYITPFKYLSHFRERLFVFPKEMSYFITSHMEYFPEVLEIKTWPLEENDASIKLRNFTRTDFVLPLDYFLFINFSFLYKIDEATFRLWCRILAEVKHAALVLLKKPGEAADLLYAISDEYNVSSRIFFAPMTSKEHHMYRHVFGDVFLDTPQVNSHTVAADALFAGMPLITRSHTKFGSRIAGSLLNSYGAEISDELIVTSEEAYFERAVQLATDEEYYTDIRRKLLKMRETSTLFDTKLWVQHFEVGLEEIYKATLETRPKENIYIPFLNQK